MKCYVVFALISEGCQLVFHYGGHLHKEWYPHFQVSDMKVPFP